MNRVEASKILGVSVNANEKEVRRAFKRLALKIHPDVNPSPEANEEFLRLKMAMELMINPSPIEETNIRTSRKTTGKETEEELIDRLKKAKERFHQQQAYKTAENNQYYQNLTSGLKWRIFKFIAALGLIFSIALSLEWILPHHFEEDELLGCSKANYSGILKRNITAIELEKRGVYFTNFNRGTWLTTYPEVLIETTWVLHTPIFMHNTDDFRQYRTDFDFHAGSIQTGLIILFLIPLFTIWYKRKTLYFVFLYHFSFWFIGLILLYQLLTQERWLHLISLGFV